MHVSARIVSVSMRSSDILNDTRIEKVGLDDFLDDFFRNGVSFYCLKKFHQSKIVYFSLCLDSRFSVLEKKTKNGTSGFPRVSAKHTRTIRYIIFTYCVHDF